MTDASAWLGPAQAHAAVDEKIVYTYHQAHCRGNCTLVCTVRDGRVCAIEPNSAAAEGSETNPFKVLGADGLVYNADYDFGDLLAAWERPKDMKSTKLKTPMFDLPYMEDSDIHALITWGDLQPRFADLTSLEEWLKTLDFVCAADVVNIATTNYADLVLPISTRFECDEEIGAAKTARWHAALREKCIDPLFDSRTDFQAMRTIAEAFGVADALPKTALEMNPIDMAERGLVDGDEVTVVSRFALPVAILVHSVTAWIFGLQIAKEG